jgi:hypothetical protein
MEQERSNGTEKNNLEHKITFWDRAKYASIPVALTVGACFIPNAKNKYDVLSQDKQNTYKAVALTGTAILGAAIAIFSSYKLARNKS